jgi:hypothetical protein
MGSRSSRKFQADRISLLEGESGRASKILSGSALRSGKQGRVLQIPFDCS